MAATDGVEFSDLTAPYVMALTIDTTRSDVSVSWYHVEAVYHSV